MPVRSLRSSVLRWPDAETVGAAVGTWARALAAGAREVLGVGYFGSYARGDWGVGSDVDILVVVAGSGEPRERRARRWPAESLPVPADVIVLTAAEWRDLRASGSRFGRVIGDEARWVLGGPPFAG